jgi:hypothetical protein
VRKLDPRRGRNCESPVGSRNRICTPHTGSILALCRVGFAALGLGDVDEAQRTQCKALEQAHASAAISLELLALSGVGAVLCEPGELEQAATMLSFALGHEQLPPAYSSAARRALDRVEAELACGAACRGAQRGCRGAPRRPERHPSAPMGQGRRP